MVSSYCNQDFGTSNGKLQGSRDLVILSPLKLSCHCFIYSLDLSTVSMALLSHQSRVFTASQVRSQEEHMQGFPPPGGSESKEKGRSFSRGSCGYKLGRLGCRALRTAPGIHSHQSWESSWELPSSKLFFDSLKHIFWVLFVCFLILPVTSLWNIDGDF
jgi:hypothetical protein